MVLRSLRLCRLSGHLLWGSCILMMVSSLAGDETAKVLPPRQMADQILAETGVTGGLIVHLGCGDGRLTAELSPLERAGYLVQGLDRDPGNVRAARAYVRERGSYGQVTINQLSGTRLPYIDNMANLVVAENLHGVPMPEVMRVLCPGGMAYVKQDGKWTKSVKPRPESIDEWTHYLHDASNNAVAHDTVVGPPRRLQWTDGPRYSRHHDRMSSVSAVVTSGGRVFSIEDEASPISILLPSRWMLTARDAFNGTLLWTREIDKWFTQFWPLKSGPAQLPRRLVASGNRVYVTLGFEAPFVALDATTGATVRTYAGTEGTEEAILSDGILYLVVNRNVDASQYTDPKRFSKGYGAKYWDEAPRELVAVRAETGQRLWSHQAVVLPATLSANQRRIVFHNGESVVCLDRESGDNVWRSEPVARAEEIKSFYLPILVLHDDVVLFSGGETAGGQTGSWYEQGKDSMTALALEDGHPLWSAYHPPSGYRSPEDLLVVNGLVWTGETTSGRATGVFTGRDPHTGEVVSEFKPDISTYWFHHRCYRGKATDNFLLMSRTGTEFIDVRQESWTTNHWVRGACLYGVMPANGLLYAPRHPCACYLESKLYGFNALAPASEGPRIPASVDQAERLVKGPAFENVSGSAVELSGSENDWPTYRHDAGRTGRATSTVATALVPAWRTHFGGKLTSPVVAEGRAFVASVDTHVVHALDAGTGERLWYFQASGRVDSPPTIYAGRVLFGSADGWVYCLRAADGQLVWQFLAAPMQEQLVSYGQLESVWPVPGSVLVQNNVLYLVAGRSMFVDGGLRLWRLDPLTGKVLSQTVLDDRDATGKRLEDYVSWLNMPAALPDILSSDGNLVYMRSQPFQLDGTRLPLAAMPRKDDADQGAPEPIQNPEYAHIFCPTGFLDDTWWHRTYWMYGSTFISGWSGYYLSGKVAPAGRLLVTDDAHVYGFGRKPQYFRWTTPIEHHLFCADKELSPRLSPPRKGPAETRVTVAKSKSLNSKETPITVTSWIKADEGDGVIVARGGNAQGYVLCLVGGRPQFAVRAGGQLTAASATEQAVGTWVHLAGVLSEDKKLSIYLNGRLAGTGTATDLITSDPSEALEIGADEGSNVGDYANRFAFTGLIDDLRVFHRTLTADEIRQAAAGKISGPDKDPKMVLAFSFDDGTATDVSGNENQGKVEGATAAAGRSSHALKFEGGENQVAGYTVKLHWTQDLPMLVRAMVLAGDTLFVAGPPDVLNEETAFRRINDPAVQQELVDQLASVEGKHGAMLWALSTKDGARLAEYSLDAPPVFDGMAAAQGRLYLTTIDGQVQCYAPR